MKRSRQTRRYLLESLEPRRLLATNSVDLGTLGGGFAEPSDINASGQVVGRSNLANGAERAFLWQNSVMIDLGTLGGPADYSRANAINDAGQVVGQSASHASVVAAFLLTPEDTDGNGKPDRWYRDTNGDGKNDLMRDLGTLGGTYTQAIAYDVNNSGQVVGFTAVTYPRAAVHHAFRWHNGVMTDLGTFGGQGSYAHTINDAGQVGGVYSSSGYRAFLWKNGVATDMGPSSGVADINASGQFVDQQWPVGRMWTPTVPNGSSGTFTTLGQLPASTPYLEHGIETRPQSINAAGHVVGTQVDIYYSENSTSYEYRGMRWINGVPQELPLEDVAAINDAGHIAGSRGGRAYLLANENFAMSILTISGATVTEGHSGTTNAVFTVSLSKASAQTVTARYATADGSATAGEDYLATSGTITFAPGQASRTISVAILGDRIADFGEMQTFTESFTVALSNPSNALVAGDPASGVIRDDEPRVSGATTTVLEGNTGSKTALVTISLSSAYDQPVTVGYETGGGTATAGDDYVATTGAVTFAPGQTSKQIAVSVLGDRVAEANGEFIYVFLSPGVNAGRPTSHGGVQIQDDEPSVTLSRYVQVYEPASGTIDALLTVSLSAASDEDVVVEYSTYDGDGPSAAYAASDYVATAGSVRIPAGQTSRTISVPVIGDGLVEEGEYFSVVLTGVSGNAFIPWNDGWGAWADVGIWDYDGSVKTWIGPASGGNWSTAANWSPAGVPTASNLVAIAGKAVTLSGNATVGALTLSGGATLTLAAHGGRVLRTSSISISATSKLNLADNNLIVDYDDGAGASPVGGWNGVAHTGVGGLVAAGRTPGATWDGGGGIGTSMPGALGGVTGLAVAEAAGTLFLSGTATALWEGQTVDATTVLVKYTYLGDANLDGLIDGADYGVIDNCVQFPGTSGYVNGDFNYDGVIDGADYGLIDNSVQLQGPSL